MVRSGSKEKKLIISKDNGEFILKRVNQFGTPFVRRFISENGLLESLLSYKENGILDEYEIIIEVNDPALRGAFKRALIKE